MIRWLPRAIQDRDAQIDYVAARNPLAAIDQGDLIDTQISQLIAHPEIGRPGRVDGTRELVISGTPLIVIYHHVPEARRIDILRLLHGAQQWPPGGQEN
ncbi:MAG: type II toxin-antitoxin system RelE/ParE family toxin [Acidobacteriaceae bacterium]